MLAYLISEGSGSEAFDVGIMAKFLSDEKGDTPQSDSLSPLVDETIFKESRVIANYANTHMTPEQLEFGGFSLVHGAKKRWSFDAPLALVVSDFENGNDGGGSAHGQRFLKSMLNVEHSFTEIVMFVPSKFFIRAYNDVKKQFKEKSIDLKFVVRTTETYMDVCEAYTHVSSSAYMVSNVYSNVRNRGGLLQSSDGRHVTPSINVDSEECTDMCDEIVRKAAAFGSVRNFVADDEIVYRTALMGGFCNEWAFGIRTSHAEELWNGCTPKGPHATEYVTWAENDGKILDKLYELYVSWLALSTVKCEPIIALILLFCSTMNHISPRMFVAIGQCF